jgi:hypothetical protein
MLLFFSLSTGDTIMTIAHTFSAAEIAAYNAANAVPHRKIVAAQVAESKLPPMPPRRESYPYGEMPDKADRGATAEQVLEHDMLHGQNS